MPARKISVVIPALNEDKTVGRVAAEMLASPFVSEVIVVDNGSDDRTSEVATRAGATVIRLKERGFGRALKTGFAAARESLIFKIDADMLNASRQWPGDLLTLLGSSDGLVKAYWSSSVDPMPITNLVVRPLIRRLFPALAGIRMPLAGIYLVNKELPELDTMSNGWPFDVEVVLRMHRAGYGIQQKNLGEVIDTYKPVDMYHEMSWELISFLLNESGVA
ncbi:MAG TPA: glycosyltransferase, partial [Thermoanaerobaculia bacterium]|nr:glycosyltransferase [Thermoanaerobaculia bacterium]